MPHRPSFFASWFQFGLSAILSAWLIATPAQLSALPTGAQVQHGQLTINVGGQTMTIDQHSPLAVINWQDFSIGANELVAIQQLGLDSALLNRVTGADPSKLFGQLSANGRVYVVNPNGVLIGPNARINTQQFIASALDVSDQDFLAGGGLKFAGESDQPVVNLGEITAANGDVILVAQVVRNAGTIAAPNGTAALAAGREVLYRPEADQRIVIASDVANRVAETGVENTGLIAAAQAELKAAGGNVYDLAINQDGIVQATGITRKNGRVLLTSDGGEINHGGKISAHNADGSGGEVLIGGDAHGANAAVANAERVRVSADAVIDVSAVSPDVDAGRAIVWADGQTDFAGKIEGQGGALGGDGAFAEVSGKRILNYHGLADLSAANGETGTLLLDPENAVISTATDDQPNGVFNNSVIENNLLTAHVEVDSSGYSASPGPGGGNVIVNAPVSWTSGNTLTLKAESAVQVNADLTGTGGDIVFLATGGAGGLSGGGAAVIVDSDATITANTLSIGQNPDATFPGMNPLPPGDRSLGGIAINGTLDVDTLDFRLENAGIHSGISVDNPANRIGTLTTSVTSGTLNGDFHVVNGDGDLTLDGDFSAGESGFDRDVTIVTPGDLTLAAGTQLSTGTTDGTLVLASTGGSFINQAGSAALTVGTNASSRYLIYSDDPANTIKGGLTALPVYDKTHAADAPGTITQTGNRFLYSLAPTLTITADDLTRSENVANPTLTYTVTGLVGGDNAGQAITGAPLLQTTAGMASPAGDYDITIAPNGVTSDFGYALNFVPGTLSIELIKIINIKADDLSRFFGDANPTFTYTPTGFVGGDDISLLAGFTVGFETDAVPTSNVGTYTIEPSGAATVGDYDVTYQNGTLTIDPRLLTITADNAVKNYFDDDPTFTATWSGLASFHDETAVSGLNFDAPGGRLDVGAYTITPKGAADLNYAITFVPGTLTVNPAPITVTALDQSRAYGSDNAELNIRTTGQPFGTSIDRTGLNFTLAANAASDVGTYAITPGGLTNPNYAVTYVPGTLTINPAAASVTANDATREYGDPNPDFTGAYGGFVLDHTIVDVVPDLAFTTNAGLGSGVGSHYSITPTGTPNPNYSVAFNPGTLTITRAPISLIALGQTHRFYGDANPSSYNLNIVGLKNGDSPANNAVHIFTTTTATPLSGVGTYPVTFDVVSSTNYSIHPSVLVPGTLVIDPRPLTITADSFTREYGDANPILTATFDNLASFHTAASAFPSLTIETPASPASGVLDYGINILGANNANYAVTTVPGTLSVTAAPITFGSADFTFMYGDNPSSSVMANYTGGLKLGDTIASLGAQVSAGGARDVGTYPVTVTLNNSNYYVSSVAGSITINPRPVYFRIGNAQRIYGEELGRDYVINATGGYGLVDPLEQVFEADDSTTIRSDVGIYLVGGKLINSNYQLLGVDQGILRITPRVIAIKPENTGHTYGDTFLGVDYLVTGADGLAPFHTIEDVVADTILTQYTAGRNFGFTYAYELLPEGDRRQLLDSFFQSGGDFSHLLTPGGYQTKAIIRDDAIRNYYVVSAPGTISVVPRPVTLRVEDAVGVKNNFINPFISFVDNLAPIDEGQTGISIFEDLTYELVPEGTPERVQTSVEVTDVPSAPAFTDADFLARYTPAAPSTPAPPASSGGGASETVEPPPGGLTATEVPIQIEDPSPDQPAIVEVTGISSVSVTNRTIVINTNGVRQETEIEEEVDSRLLDQVFSIRPANFANDNYVVTNVKMGTLTIRPDPVEVAAALEEQKIAALREQFYDPGYTSGDMRIHTKMAMGFTPETLPVIFDMIDWMMKMEKETRGTTHLWGIIRSTGGSMVTDKDRSFKQDIELFFSDLHSNPDTQAFLAGIMKDYTAALVRGDVEPTSEAGRAYKERVETYMGASKEAMARKVEEQMKAWENRTTPEGKELAQRQRLLADNQTALDALAAKINEATEKLEQERKLEKQGGVAVNPMATQDYREGLLDQYDALIKQRQEIQSPEAIAARKALFAVTGQGGDMVQVLLAGDVPYNEIVNSAMGDLVEESVNSYAASSVTVAAGNTAMIGAVPLTQIAGNSFLKTAAAAAQKASEEAAKKVMAKGIDAFYKVGQEAAQKAFDKIAAKAGEKGLTKAAEKAALKAATEIGKKAAQEALEKAAEKAGEAAAKKVIDTGLKKAVNSGLSRVLGKVFTHATDSTVKQAASKAAGKLASTLASRASALTGFAAGVSFALSTGIERAIMIGKLADGEAYMKSLTENPTGRDLKLRPDPNVTGKEAVEKQNTRMKVDLTIFNVGFLNMISDTNPSALSSGFSI